MIVTFSSCQNIDENILPIIGICRAHVVGIAIPFDLIISTNGGEDVIIETPVNGVDWFIVVADIDNQEEPTMAIKIKNPQISSGMKMKGSGFFNEGTLELKYEINVDSKIHKFTIVGTKF